MHRPLPSVLITGAGKRLGLYNANKLLDEGHQVIASYRTMRPSVTELQQRGAIMIQADFSTLDGIVVFIETLRMQTNCLRAIVHNASIWPNDNTVANQPETFLGLVNVHMLAPYLINTQCVDLLLNDRGSELRDILHMSDQAVCRGSSNHAAYLASKAGLESMTRSFAKKYAPRIKVNAIAPGLIRFNPDDDEHYKAKTLSKAALPIEPGEQVVWQTLQFIFNNPYMTGEIIPLRGGRHLL